MNVGQLFDAIKHLPRDTDVVVGWGLQPIDQVEVVEQLGEATSYRYVVVHPADRF